MNIFYIDRNPQKAAEYLSDQHIRKMQIESAQMLSTAHWMRGSQAPYKKTHENHPSAKWARQSLQHYRWLVKHGLAICEEFKKRYGKTHATEYVLEYLKNNEPNIPDIPFQDPPQCTADDVQDKDAVVGYRNYYIKHKLPKMTWKFTEKPEWIKEQV